MSRYNSLTLMEVGIKALGSAKNIQELLPVTSGVAVAPYSACWVSYRRVRVFLCMTKMYFTDAYELARWASIEGLGGHSIQVAPDPINNDILPYPYRFKDTGRWSASDSGGDWRVLLDATLDALAERQEQERSRPREWTRKMASIENLWNMFRDQETVGNLERYLRWRIGSPRYYNFAAGVLDRKHKVFIKYEELKERSSTTGSLRMSLLDMKGEKEEGHEQQYHEWEKYLPTLDKDYEYFSTEAVSKAILTHERKNIVGLCNLAGIPVPEENRREKGE